MRGFTVAFLSLAIFGFAEARDFAFEIEQAQRKCSQEQGSMLRERRGTPSCEQARQLIDLQRLQLEADVSRETGQPMPSHSQTDIIVETPERRFNWQQENQRERRHH